jgi:hypothetical protein
MSATLKIQAELKIMAFEYVQLVNPKLEANLETCGGLWWLI